jgi:rhodanese-related sulfurtransferase
LSLELGSSKTNNIQHGQRIMKKALLLVTMVSLATAVFAAEAPDINIPDLKAAIADGKVAVIDANGTKSWREGHIPGAIDFTSNKDKLTSLLPADKQALVVAYCGGPKCMAYKKAVSAVEKLGYTNVKHLSAGISGWKKAGEKMETGS